MYQSTKTFGHELGLSCAFRQWRAKSHCSKVHGYALSFKYTFEAETLDDTNWVVDFGGLKDLKQALQNAFDHKFVIALDDPLKDYFKELHVAIDFSYMTNVGCEAFAEHAYKLGELWLYDNGLQNRVRLVSCECAEHGANSALYLGENK